MEKNYKTDAGGPKPVKLLMPLEEVFMVLQMKYIIQDMEFHDNKCEIH